MIKTIKKLLGLYPAELELIENAKTISNEEDLDDDDEDELVDENTDDPPPVGILQLNLLKNGDVNIECEWFEEDDQTAIAYGEMLYYLGTGKLNSIISNILVGHAETGMNSHLFIQKTLIAWFKLLNENSSAPLIKPSQALSPQNAERDNEE